MKKNLGITLVEMLVALCLSLFLLSCVFQIYLGVQKSFSIQAQLSALQENARVVK